MRVIGATNDSDLRPYYEGRRQGRDLSAAEQYGEALAQIRAGRAADASETLRALAKSSPNLPLLHSSLGQAELAAGRPSESLRVLQDALDVSPRNVPLSIRCAEVLMQTGRSKEAHLLLLDLFNNIVPTPEQIRLTALAASGAGDVADAYYYMSEYQIANGDLMLATQQLELALAAPSLTAVQRARFAARLREIRDFLAANPRKGGARNRSDEQ
jgi:predicted Zn-dependent protease